MSEVLHLLQSAVYLPQPAVTVRRVKRPSRAAAAVCYGSQGKRLAATEAEVGLYTCIPIMSVALEGSTILKWSSV